MMLKMKQMNCKFLILKVQNKNLPIKLSVTLENIPILMELDSGSAVTVFSKALYDKYFANKPLFPSMTTLVNYAGTEIYPVGVVSLNVTYSKCTQLLDVLVVEKSEPALLGRDFMCKFNLSICDAINHLNVQNELIDKLCAEFKSVFANGIGTFTKGKIEIKLKPTAEPKFFKPRVIPYALKEKVEIEIERLEN